MKRTKNNRRQGSMTCSALLLAFTASASAANLYWDSNGTGITGAGATPSGTWGTSVFWNTDSLGDAGTISATTTGFDDVFFSAGTDAAGSYAVALTGTQTARLVTFEEGTVTISGGTALNLAAGGITVLAGSGNPIISSGLTIAGNNTFNVGTGRTLTLNTGAFTRGTARATLNVQLGAGSFLASSQAGLNANTNSILGPWASIGTGTATRYAGISGGNIVAITGTAAASAANVTDIGGTFNYDVAAAGTLGASASVNTLRYTGATGGTLTSSTLFTTKGIMLTGAGNLTLLGGAAWTAGAAATEIVVNVVDATSELRMTGATATMTGTITKTGAGIFDLRSGAAHSIGALTVNEGVLIANHLSGDLLPSATINNGGTMRFGGSNKFLNSAVFTINAGGSLDVVGFNDTIGSLSGTGSVTGTSAGYLQLSAATTFAGTIGGGMGLRLPNAVAITLSGAKSYTGATQLNLSGATLSLTNANPLGTTPGTNGTSGISMIAGTILQSATAGTNPTTTIAAPITLSGAGDTILRIGQGAASNTHTFNLNGVIGGATGNVVYTTTTGTFGNGSSVFVIGAAGTYSGNTLITTGNGSNNPVFLRAGSGVVNALPATTILTFDGVTGGGTGRNFQFDMNGNDQTLAGLTNTVASLRRQTFTNGASLATLTINNTADMSFGGSDLTSGSTTRVQITGAINLTKSGAGTFTLGGILQGGATAGGHTHTGATKVTGGILVLGEFNSLQNSAFDTTGSIPGDATNGLRTTPATLTLGGLTGTNNFSTRFTSATGGYTSLTALTLNPGTGVNNSYAADLGNGNGSMTLTKTGAGIQTLTAANTHSGVTAINSGGLVVTANNALGTTAGNTTVAPGASLGLSGGVDYSTTEGISGSGTGIAAAQGVFAQVQRGFIQSVSGSNTFAGDIDINAAGVSRLGTQEGASLILTGRITQATGTILFRTGSLGGEFVTLSNPGNTFGGDSAIFNVTSAGIWSGVRLGVTDALPTNRTIQGQGGLGAALDLNGKDQTLNGLNNGSGSLSIINLDSITPSILKLNPTADQSTTNTTILGGGGLGVVSLVKEGPFTQTLGGINTYTGTTSITSGTLLINGSTAGASTVTVGASGTLGGSGTVNGNTTVTGTLSPGNSPGVLSFGGNLGLGSTTLMEINGSTRDTQYDGVNVLGGLTYNGGMTLNVGLVFGTGVYTFDLFNSGSQTGSLSSIALINSYTGSLTNDGLGTWGLTDGDNTWSFAQSTGDLSLTVVPEPGAPLLGALGLLAFLGRRRLRKVR